jgi:aminoglycoside 6'-N-acetyltransferase I
MDVRAINIPDKPAWLVLRRRLLPALSDRDHERDWLQMMEQRGQRMTLVCVGDQGALLGMIEVSRQPSMERLEAGPVAHVNTLYVEPGGQREEAAERLAAAAAKWALARGCRILASDTSLDNQWEQKLHLDLGFEEVARKVVYRKTLSAAPGVDMATDAEPQAPRPSPVTKLHPDGRDRPDREEHGDATDDGPAWWPGPVRAAIVVLGILCFYFTDVFSNNVFFGVVLPIVDLVFVIYLMFLFVDMKYRRRTGADERRIELYQGPNDGE